MRAGPASWEMKIDLQGVIPAQTWLAAIPDEVEKRLPRLGGDAADLITDYARAQMTVNDSIATGNLFKSLRSGTRHRHRRRGSEFDVIIFVDEQNRKVYYAPYLEFGTDPHWAPIRPLIVWVEAKGIARGRAAVSVAYAVQHSIARHGTRPHPFWYEGANKASNAILIVIADVVQEAINAA